MLLFLVIILSVNLLVYYKIFNKNLLSPSFLFTVGLLVSCISALLVQNEWNVHFEIDTVFIIYIGDILFFIGELVFFPYFSGKISGQKLCMPSCQKTFKSYAFWAVFLFILALIYIRGLLVMAREAGWQSGAIGLLYYIRRATEYSDDISMSRFASWSFNLLEAYAFYSALCIAFRNCERKIRFAFIMSVAAYLVACIFSAGRFPIIIFFICCLFFSCIRQYQLNGISHRSNRRIGRKLLPAVILFAVFFLIMGFARRNHENDQNRRNSFETIAVYVGSGIIGLNQYVVQNGHRSSYPGQTTLNGFYTLFNKFGGDFPTQKNTLEFINITTRIKTNIYSAFGRLVPDFGVGGCFVIVFFMGALYALFYYIIRNTSGYGMLVYGASVYPLLLVGIEEVALVRFLSIDYMVRIVFFFIIYMGFRLVIEKKYLKVV